MNGRHMFAAFCCILLATFARANFNRFPLLDQTADDAFETNVRAGNAIEYRLPNNTRPLAYDIHLTTNVHRADFNTTGRVRITIEVLISGTRTITLHQRQLTIVSAQLHRILGDASEQPIAVDVPAYTESVEQLVVSLGAGEADLQTNERYVLIIDYTGELRNDVRGFYRSSYVNDAGEVRWLAGTHFEPTNARHGFPSFDEPGLRATFRLRLTHGAELFAVSNMPVERIVSSADGTTKTTEFGVTPPMPTYLNAWAITDFSSVSNTNEANGFVQHLYVRPNAVNRSAFGLETGRRVMDAFEDKFKVRYSLPKMDQIAVPRFSGAMENWGLIIYGEAYLLYSEAYNTFTDKFNVATTVVHEFAHQWFGNHVTNKWWTFNWLNEGFASLYENQGTDWLFPEWGVMDTYVYSFTQNVMIHDSTNATRPMSRYVESPAEISSNFDSIGYSKAGCVLNMFMHAFTDRKFHDGLTIYLNRHENSTAVEEHLFDALQETVFDNLIFDPEFNVPKIMSSWTRQAGYPLVSAERNYSSGIVVLHQDRYLSNLQEIPDFTSKWWIPYNFASAGRANFNDTEARGWISPNGGDVTERVENLTANDWLLVNKRQTGYYRVIYDRRNYELLSAALLANRDSIHVASRSQLIDDLFDFARTERVDYGLVFDFIRYLEHESEYVPWASAFRGLDLIDRLHSGSKTFHKYETFIVKLLSHLYGEAGLSAKSGEHFFRQHARRLAIRWACAYGEQRCIAQANEVLSSVLEAVNLPESGNLPESLHRDYRAEILCAGMRNASVEQSDRLWLLFALSTNAEERPVLLRALGCAGSAELQRTLIERSLLGTLTIWQSDERYQLFVAIVDNRRSIDVLLDVLTYRLDDVVHFYGAGNAGAVIERLATLVNNEERRLKFFGLLRNARQINAIADISVTRAERVVEQNDRWLGRNQVTIDAWIERNSASTMMWSSILLFVAIIVHAIQ